MVTALAILFLRIDLLTISRWRYLSYNIPPIGTFSWLSLGCESYGFRYTLYVRHPLDFYEAKVPSRGIKEIFLYRFLQCTLCSFCFAVFFGYMGIYVVLFYIQLYSVQHSSASLNIANLSITIINASSALGRLASSYFADKIGPLNMTAPFTLSAALLAFFWIAMKSSASIIAFSVLFGTMSGAFFALPGPTVISISKDLSSVGLQIGMMTGFAGAGVSIGTPIAGAVLGNHHWVGLQIFAGASVAVSVLLILIARSLKVGWKLNVKA